MHAGNSAPCAQHTEREFRFRHFQAEEEDGLARYDGDVIGDICRERRLSHRRARRENNKFRAVQAAEHSVEIDKTGRDASDTPFRARVDNMEDVLHKVVHRLNTICSAIVVDGEDFLFGLRDELFRLGFGIVRLIEDLFARLNELSANRVLLNNFGVVDGVRGYLNGRHKFREILFAADLDELAA